MKEIPIDKIDNCERMLATGQYQTDEFKDKEDRHFCLETACEQEKK